MEIPFIAQVLGWGFVVSLVMIPVVRYFWKKWDRPDAEVRQAIEEHRLAKEEEIIWLEAEAVAEAERMEKLTWVRSPVKNAPTDEAKEVAFTSLDAAMADIPDEFEDVDSDEAAGLAASLEDEGEDEDIGEGGVLSSTSVTTSAKKPAGPPDKKKAMVAKGKALPGMIELPEGDRENDPYDPHVAWE